MTAQVDPLAKYRTMPGVNIPVEKSEKAPVQETPKDDPLAKYRQLPETGAKTEEGEDISRNIFRTLYQIPSGLAKAVTYPLDLKEAGGQLANKLLDVVGLGGTPEQKQKIEESNVPKALRSQTGLEEFIEEKTGLPLRPKTKTQKILKLGSTAASLSPGGIFSKGVAATTAPAVSESLQYFGVPEKYAEPIGLLASPGPSILTNLIRPKGSKAIIGEVLGPENLPATTRTSAKKAFEELQGRPPPYTPPPLRIPEGAPRPPGAPGTPQPPQPIRPTTNVPAEAPQPIRGRVRAGESEIEVRPAPAVRNLEEDVGQLFHPQRVANMTEGGRGIMQEVQSIDNEAYRNVNELYNQSREANSQIQDIHPQLVNEINGRINEIQAIPHPSGPQKQLLNLMRDVRGRLAQVDAEGNVTGYTPISNQDLINQIQSTHQILDFDFAHGNPKGIFRPFLHDIETSISRTAAASGNEQALQSWNQARTAYADWAQTFDNDYIRPLRNTTNRDYAKTFKSALDPDEFNVLTHVLDLSPQGQNLNQLVMKEVVNKNLEKYYIDPRKSVGSRDFKETLRELSSVVPEEGISRIKDFFSNASRRPAIRAKAPEKAISKETPAVQKASRFLEKGESEIINSLKTIEGMRDLGKELKATEAGAKNFETLQKHKLRSILQEGNIKKNFKGDDLARTLTKENNYEFVEEILGKEETAALLEAAEKTGNQQLKIESLKKIGKNALSYKALKFIIPLLP